MTRRDKPIQPVTVPEDRVPLDAPTWVAVVAALELSPQQARIVELLLCGRRDKQIAQAMSLSVPTVRTYLGRIFLRLGVQDRVELILRVFATAHALQTRCHQNR